MEIGENLMKLRALVIDDSRVMRTMVTTALRDSHLADFTFVEAEDGEDALGKFHPKKIDIVFADWNMPKMSGVDFARAVRDMGNTDHIPIVMITSEKSVGKIEEALDGAGANAFISKPFTLAYMIRKLGPIIDNIEKQHQSGCALFG